MVFVSSLVFSALFLSLFLNDFYPDLLWGGELGLGFDQAWAGEVMDVFISILHSVVSPGEVLLY